MSDELLDKADALMRRRNIAPGGNTAATAPGPAAATPLPVQSAPAPLTQPTEKHEPLAALSAELPDEDFPVLTEVVEGSDAAPSSSDAAPHSADLALQIEATVRERLDHLLKERQAHLSQEIESWLDEQMPQLVIRAMDGITDHLVALLASRVRDELLARLEETPLSGDKTAPNPPIG